MSKEVKKFTPLKGLEIKVHETELIIGSEDSVGIFPLSRDDSSAMAEILERAFSGIPTLDQMKERIVEHVESVTSTLPTRLQRFKPISDILPEWLEEEFRLKKGLISNNKDIVDELSSWLNEYYRMDYSELSPVYEEYLSYAIFMNNPVTDPQFLERILKDERNPIGKVIKSRALYEFPQPELDLLHPTQRNIIYTMNHIINEWLQGVDCESIHSDIMMTSLNVIAYLSHLTNKDDKVALTMKRLELYGGSFMTGKEMEILKEYQVLVKYGERDKAETAVGPMRGFPYVMSVEFLLVDIAVCLISVVECIKENPDFLRDEPLVKFSSISDETMDVIHYMYRKNEGMI